MKEFRDRIHVEAAMRRGKVNVGEAIMIGDTPYDIGAATNAGISSSIYYLKV